MSRLVPMKLEGGVEVQVETREGLVPEVREVSARKRVENGLVEALDVVAAFGKTAAERLRGLAESSGPDEVEIEFGVTVGAEAGVVLTSGSVEGNLKVTLTWKKSGAA